jgi:hypothetical protein
MYHSDYAIFIISFILRHVNSWATNGSTILHGGKKELGTWWLTSVILNTWEG